MWQRPLECIALNSNNDCSTTALGIHFDFSPRQNSVCIYRLIFVTFLQPTHSSSVDIIVPDFYLLVNKSMCLYTFVLDTTEINDFGLCDWMFIRTAHTTYYYRLPQYVVYVRWLIFLYVCSSSLLVIVANRSNNSNPIVVFIVLTSVVVNKLSCVIHSIVEDLCLFLPIS